MKYSFSVYYKGDLNKLLNIGLKEALRLSGELDGNTHSGKFKIPSPLGLFQGSYKVYDFTIYVQLEKKPFFLTDSFIKNQVASYLTNYIT